MSIEEAVDVFCVVSKSYCWVAYRGTTGSWLFQNAVVQLVRTAVPLWPSWASTMRWNRVTCGTTIPKCTVNSTVLVRDTVKKRYRGIAVVPWYRPNTSRFNALTTAFQITSTFQVCRLPATDERMRLSIPLGSHHCPYSPPRVREQWWLLGKAGSV